MDLACDCADKPSCKSWGGGDNEDITKCRHFRDYHEYVYKIAPLIEAKKKQACLVDPNVPKKPWDEMHLPYLDSWVATELLDTNQPDMPADFFCENTHFRLWRLHVIFKGGKLFFEVKQQDSAWDRCFSDEEWEDKEEQFKKAWDELYKLQNQGWKWFRARAKAFISLCCRKQ